MERNYFTVMHIDRVSLLTAVFFVGKVITVIFAITLPRQRDAAPICTLELITLTRYTQTTWIIL